MADLVTLQGWLLDAETKRHALRTGTQAAQVEHGDMRLTYTKAMAGELDAYIDSLKSQIAAAGGTPDGLRRRGLAVRL